MPVNECLRYRLIIGGDGVLFTLVRNVAPSRPISGSSLSRTTKKSPRITCLQFFLASGITFAAVLALIVGVMMWSGQQHLAKLKAQQRRMSSRNSRPNKHMLIPLAQNPPKKPRQSARIKSKQP